ncbi:hypothetical protein M378DRAFT_14293 [Amanita muscaria Koide BX008]|uniref:Uncharacterized protein n=1 Tax=Amanita muscaria (strain Koide BX008) TaxID=946122 RepID=A0A0C2T189_AMAMK|nr:hypothetical protein M378DRAFT_14293 [Amanita muscaria Koide BX008]
MSSSGYTPTLAPPTPLPHLHPYVHSHAQAPTALPTQQPPSYLSHLQAYSSLDLTVVKMIVRFVTKMMGLEWAWTYPPRLLPSIPLSDDNVADERDAHRLEEDKAATGCGTSYFAVSILDNSN